MHQYLSLIPNEYLDAGFIRTRGTEFHRTQSQNKQ